MISVDNKPLNEQMNNEDFTINNYISLLRYAKKTGNFTAIETLTGTKGSYCGDMTLTIL